MPPAPLPFRLILASVSPRRRKIFEDAGLPFEAADPGDVEESITSASTPDELAIGKARAKAEAIARTLTPPFPAVVVGSDTLVALGNDVIGKPLDRADARSILARLSGTRHRVISGVCLARAPGPEGGAPAPILASDVTWVTMKRMSSAEIDAYVESGQSDGKAGAYAIQENGDRFVEKLEGDFLNVVGFPLDRFLNDLLPRAIREWR